MSKELSDFETAVYPDTSSAPATNLTGNKLEISGDQKTAAPIDIQELTKLSHDEILKLDAASRITWFENIKENHLELEMIRNHLSELLAPQNDTKVINIIGPTGIGKTTLATRITEGVVKQINGQAELGTCPVLFVKAPANGEKSLSWTSFYNRILNAANEPAVDAKREFEINGGIMKFSSKTTVHALRDAIESMLTARKVKVVIVDEAFHLLRFKNYTAVMDTIKSLADCSIAKLILIGDYSLVDVASEYGQVARRSEILHYKRYHHSKPRHRKEFERIIQRLQNNWPCAEAPNFTAISEELMDVSLGSVGFLKSLLTKTALLQMKAKDEKFSMKHLSKSVKSKKLLATIERETVDGEKRIEGHCYGESIFGDAQTMEKLRKQMGVGDNA
jgi:energy-coupling factor transporter ATP-binding protein EcfA2